jgi:hypothetical protein
MVGSGPDLAGDGFPAFAEGALLVNELIEAPVVLEAVLSESAQCGWSAHTERCTTFRRTPQDVVLDFAWLQRMMRSMAHDDDVFEIARLTLRQLMDERELRQEDLAPVIGLTQQVLSDRLRGRSRLTLAEVQRLAHYFGVSPLAFFNGLSPAWAPSSAEPAPIKMNCGPIRSTLDAALAA